MTKHLIYFDTPIWNVLSEAPDAGVACPLFSERNVEITLGGTPALPTPLVVYTAGDVKADPVSPSDESDTQESINAAV
jgi:hypothetical protein